MTALQRLLFYFLLGALTACTPYLLTILSIIATGDRIAGMKIGFFYGLAAASAIFGMIFIREKRVLKVILAMMVAALNFALMWLAAANDLLLNIGWDIYGYWDLAVTYYLIGLIIWELYYQITKALKKDKLFSE